MTSEEVKNRVIKINEQNIPPQDVYSICDFLKKTVNNSLGEKNRYNINIEFIEIIEK